MGSKPKQGIFTISLFHLLVIGVFTIQATWAAKCPHSCKCPDEENLKVNCSGKFLMTLPTFSTSTLTLDLSHNSLGPVINTSFIQMPNLTSIDLSHNALSRLLGCTLQGMLGLKTARFHHNLLTSLPDSLFTDANTVEHLDVSHNLIQDLPDDVFRNLRSLKTLDLSHNRIVELTLGPRFQVPRHIEKIDFSYNEIETIQEDAFEIASQWEVGIERTINLAFCKISTIEGGAFSKIPNLYDLDISGNDAISGDNVTALVKELETKGLERLSVAQMNLTTIDTLFTQVTLMSLKFLNVSNNSVSAIPPNAFSTISSLRVLDLSMNSVTELSEAFSDLVNIRVLNISHNKLETFQGDAVQQMNDLHTLDVSHNMLADADNVNFSPLAKLTHLNVNNNLLMSVVLPSNTTSLQFLDYHSNSLTQFSGLHDAKSLEYFDISDNDLQKVERFVFKGALMLKVANFSRNSITAVDNNAFLPHSPLVIDLSNNFLSELRYSNWVATQILDLRNNNLSHVDSQALYGMTGLHRLDLSQNRLPTLHENTFEYLTGLRHLNLSYNGLNKVLWFDLFQNLELLETLDLGHNNVSKLDENMFLPLPKIKTLSLRKNHLQRIIPRAFRDLAEIKQIDLSNNPFDCSCDMLAFRDWLVRTKTAIVGLYTVNSTAYQCQAPPHRLGVHVTKWEPEEFECNRTMLYFIIFGSIGIFLIIAGVAGTAAYRFYLHRKQKREARKRRLEEELKARKHHTKKADHVRMTSHEIGEEIQDALERKTWHDSRHYVVNDRSNGYVPWPGGAQRMRDDDRGRERSRSDRKEKEGGVEKERHRGRHYDRLRTDDWAVDPRAERRGKDRKDSPERRGEKRPSHDGHEHRKDKDAEKRGRRRDSDYINVDHYNQDRAKVPRGRIPARYEDLRRDSRPGRGMDPGFYYDREQGYRYATEPPARSGPYIISSGYNFPGRWEQVELWGGPRSWTMQGYGRPRGHSQGQRSEGYFTMPVRGREMVDYEREIMRSKDRPEEGRHPDRYPPEVRFDERGPRHYPHPDDQRRYRRAQSYNYLPQDYPDDTPSQRKDRMQREYESIDQARGIGSRAVSQPHLANENRSDWL